jgi:hypothetical protein
MEQFNLAANLRAAKALIDTPAKWTQSVLARDSMARQVGIEDRNATCFCSMGALLRHCRDKELPGEARKTISEALDNVAELTAGDDSTNIVIYNDEHTHAEVMAVWDKAIELAEKESA